jgi:outer membrane murein-binding lipoprotein Lpp
MSVENLLLTAVAKIKELESEVQRRDARITELESKLIHANHRLKAAGFTNDIDGVQFKD